MLQEAHCCGCCHPRIQEEPVLRGGVIRVLRQAEKGGKTDSADSDPFCYNS